MNLTMRDLTKKEAKAIFSWTYPKPYDMYCMNQDANDVENLLNGEYTLVYDDDELFGFICTGNSARVITSDTESAYAATDCFDISFGINPDYHDEGLDAEYLKFVLRAVKGQAEGKPIRITVAGYNKRLLKTYAKEGYKPALSFKHPTTDINYHVLTQGK